MHGTDARRVDDHPAEVDRILAAELVQQQAVQRVPHAGLAPLVQAVPQGHAAAAHLLGEVLPGDAGLQDEQDAGQTGAIRRARLAALGAGRVFGKDRLDQRPQIVGHQQLAHRVLRDGDALNCAHGRGIWELVFLEALNTNTIESAPEGRQNRLLVSEARFSAAQHAFQA